MDIDEIVETSDVEELEELQSGLGQSLPEALENQCNARARGPMPYSPPRKRLKLFHDTSDSPPTESLGRLSVSPTKSIPVADASPLRSRSSSTIPNTDSPNWLSGSSRSSQTSVHDLHSPSKQEQQNALEGSQDLLLLRSPTQRVMELYRTPTRSPLAALPVSDNQRHTPNTLLMTPSLLNSQPTTSITRLPRPLHQSTTPAHHAPSLFSSPSNHNRKTVQADNDTEHDELLLFTPSKSTSSSAKISSLEPLSPMSVLSNSTDASVRERSQTPRSASGPSSPPLSPVPVIPQQESTINDINILDYEPQESRYSLRKRNVAQLNPYTVDDIRYKRALRSNPEAIVKLKAIERHLNSRHSGNRYEHDGESQQDVYMDEGDVDEDASWEEKERRRLEQHAEKQRRRAERERLRATASERDMTKYPDILRDLSDSDGEGLDPIAKEARRVKKQLEKEKRAREKEERRRQREEQARKAKRFPVQNPKPSVAESSTASKYSHSAAENFGDELEMDNDGRYRTENRSSRPPTSSNNETRMLQDYFGQDEGFESEPDNRHIQPTVNETRRSSRSASPYSQAPAPQEYFDGGDDFAIYDQDPWIVDGSEIPGDTIPASSTPPIDSIFDEQDEPSQPDSKVSDVELDLPPQKQRWLRKMIPKSMIKKNMLKDPAQAAAKSKKVSSKRRAVSVTSDNDQPLLPGQSRVQKVANPKDIREIKGDSESESDREVDANPSPPASPKVPSQHFEQEGDSDSDIVEILEIYRPRTQASKKEKKIPIVEIYSSEDEIDDEDIQEIFFPDEKATGNGHGSRLQDETLIDYMLTRWRNIGGSRKKKATSSRSVNHPSRENSSSSSKYKIDIMARDARGIGNSRQTLLSFDKPETSKKRRHQEGFTPQPVSSRISSSHAHSNHAGRKHASSSRRRSAQTSHHRFLDDDADMPHEYARHNEVMEVQEPSGSKAKSQTWKEKEKARRKRAQKNGVWSSNTTSGHIITSGANRNPYTVDVEETSRNFHFALAPENPTQTQREHWSKQFKPPKSPIRRIQEALREHTPEDVDDDDGEDDDDTGVPVVAKSPSNVEYTVDLHIHPLHSGRSFGATTDIGKGWLYELVNLAFTAQAPVQPITMHFCGYTINPDVSVEAFCEMLPQITESFFEFVTALPDPDQETTKSQWTAMGHAVSQHVSWYLSNAEEAEIVLLRQAVEKQIAEIVDRINQLALSFVDTPVLAFGWFAVEMAVRIGLAKPTLPTQDALPRPLKSSAATLMSLLLQSDVRETVKLLQDVSTIDGKQISHYAAELWVCLIHVFSIYLPKVNTSRNKSQPFWSILLEVLRARSQKQEELLPAEASETTWLTIFTLCALSQFSAHGITSGQPRLPACWDAAVFALKKIRLTVDPDDSNTKAAELRDTYVAIVVKRCLLLHERWKWNLHDATTMFNSLSDIFKSRKFANLWHEQGDFADFFKDANWDLLLSSNPNDTAYTVFLKLIVQAAHEDPVYIQKKTSPKVKKWLSLAVPLGNMNLPEGTQHNLSMFYNRLSAVAIAVDLDAGEYDDRTLKARTYIDFANADPTTRLAVIRGMKYWSIMMVTRGVKLNAIVDWIQEIATVVETDLMKCRMPSDASSTSGDPAQKKREKKQRKKEEGLALLFACFLLTIVRQIIDTHAKVGLYPEPSLITALKPVLMTWIRGDSRMVVQIGPLAKALFDARSLVLPPSSRPPLLAPPVNEESQESQDFGMDDFGDLDWDNIDLPEALTAKVSETVTSDIASKDAVLLQALNSVQFKWLIITFLKPYLQPPPDTSRQLHESKCDDWLRYFLCYSSLGPQADKWTNCLCLLGKMIKDTNNESWNGRVHLSIMFQLLKLDPMAYLERENHAMEVFMWALVSDHVAIEKEYVAQFLSIAGLRHPLLHGATLPSRDEASGDYSFSSEEFTEARFLYIKTIFQNLNQLVHQQLIGQGELIPTNTQYIEALQKMLSSMRSRLNSLKDTQKRASYQIFCLDVFSLYQECPELLAHEHLRFWVNWRTILTNNP